MSTNSGTVQFQRLFGAQTNAITPIFGNSVSIPSILLQKAEVTQITSATTAVTANGGAVAITTVSLTTAAGASFTFTLNNSWIQNGSFLFAQIGAYSGTVGTNGIPIVTVVNNTSPTTAGTCTITVSNVAASNALSGTLVLNILLVT